MLTKKDLLQLLESMPMDTLILADIDKSDKVFNHANILINSVTDLGDKFSNGGIEGHKDTRKAIVIF